MAQLQKFRASLVYSRQTQQRFLLCLLFGALMGACCAKLRQNEAVPISCGAWTEPSLFRACLRTSLFPLLLFLTMLLERRRLFACLLFGKGFCVGFVLCALAACGTETLRLHLPSLLPETLLPLPLLLLTASVWAAPDRDRAAVWLLIPSLLLSWLGTALGALIQHF